jgi:VWFA-related protein
MSKIRRILFSAACTLCSLSLIATAQRPRGPVIVPTPQVPAQSAFDGTIRLQVVVTDHKGNVISGLAPSDFTILDNKSAHDVLTVQPIDGTVQPSTVVIVLDTVNTPFINVSYQRSQIEKFLRLNNGQLSQPTTFAVLTDQQMRLYNQVTRDGNQLAAAMQATDIGLRTITRAQGFYGADDRQQIASHGLSELATQLSHQPGHKLVIWMSPGWPLLSGPNVILDSQQDEAIFHSVVAFNTMLRDANITLYSLNSWGATENLARAFYYQSFTDGLKKPGDSQIGNLGLQVFAEQSGGLVLNSSGVVQMLQQSYADASHYYEVTLKAPPAEHPDEYHSLKVIVDRPGLQARTREGYYDQPLAPADKP